MDNDVDYRNLLCTNKLGDICCVSFSDAIVFKILVLEYKHTV